MGRGGSVRVKNMHLVIGVWVISESVGSDRPCIIGQNILATEGVEYMSARGVPAVRVGVNALGQVFWVMSGQCARYGESV